MHHRYVYFLLFTGALCKISNNIQICVIGCLHDRKTMHVGLIRSMFKTKTKRVESEMSSFKCMLAFIVKHYVLDCSVSHNKCI